MPGEELGVTHEPTLKHEEQGAWHMHLEVDVSHKDVYVAIRDAFKAMRRLLQDYVRCLRHDVKTHYLEPTWPWAPPWSLPRHRLGRSQSSLTSR